MNYFLKISSKPFYPIVYKDKNVINGSLIATGKYIKEPLDTLLEYIDSGNSDIPFERLLIYDVLETVGGGWLISERLRDVIALNFPNEVQLFKARFTYKNEICETYSAINVYNRIDCYDLDKSIYTKHPVDGSYKFSKVVLKTEPLEEYGAFYNIVRSSFDNKVVVSEEFTKAIRVNKINSLSFKKG